MALPLNNTEIDFIAGSDAGLTGACLAEAFALSDIGDCLRGRFALGENTCARVSLRPH